MRIGIDARLINETGVGRYISNLISRLEKIDSVNEYIIFVNPKSDSLKFDNPRWQKRFINVHWHTLAEQLVMPYLFRKEKLDLVHIPYFNIPIFYRKNVVVTIHDLTTLTYATGKASTLPKILYLLKLFGLKIILTLGLKNASSIIAVSESTKNEIQDRFKIVPNKIQVTYEGFDDKLISLKNTFKTKPIISGNYFLYVGNAYPHKNLSTLINAFLQLIKIESIKDIKLVLAGPDDYFYRKLIKDIANKKLNNKIIFFGYANDHDLVNLYQNAKTLVFPSLSEGFGLPALEALCLGIPVLCSDLPIFHEILGSYARYFNPHDVKSILNQLTRIAENQPQISQSNIDNLRQKYNWDRMARETLDIYKKSGERSGL
jgi:glycosyltransferase involved in cell wall biosynthesis